MSTAAPPTSRSCCPGRAASCPSMSPAAWSGSPSGAHSAPRSWPQSDRLRSRPASTTSASARPSPTRTGRPPTPGEGLIATSPASAGARWDRIEDMAGGCVNPAHEGMGDVARWGALAAGFPDSVPAMTVNRFCASSLSCAITIAHGIRSDEVGVGLAAGVESMSRSGWALMKGDAPFSPRGPVFMLDTLWSGAGGPPNPTLLAQDAYIEMIRTAQNVADKYGLTREEIDAFALRSHLHAAAARDSGRLAAESHPVEIPAGRKQPARTFEHDEAIRGDTTAEQLAALPPQPNTTQMTAGNPPPLNHPA